MILEALGNGVRTISELAATLQVSEATVRRDLRTLEQRGELQRVHGGAVRVDEGTKRELLFHEKATLRADEKERIAEAALGLIENGDSVYLDGGSTVLALARKLGSRRELTVVTNSLAITNELAGASGIELIVTGGVYKEDEEAFLSDFASLIFSKIHVDIFFLTTCGISVEAGVTYQRMDEIPVQTKMMKAADCTIAIVDSSKLGVNSLVRMCGIESIAALVTDVGISAEQRRRFEKAGVHVVVAPERSE